MSIPKKLHIVLNGYLYESVLSDVEKEKLVSVIKNIMDELHSLETTIDSKPIINRRQEVKKNLYRTVTTISREFPELHLGPIKPELEELLA